jgi:hypothetical protein
MPEDFEFEEDVENVEGGKDKMKIKIHPNAEEKPQEQDSGWKFVHKQRV